MGVNVKTYLQALDTSGGKLQAWTTDIFTLRASGVSYQAISEYLRLNGVIAPKQEVYCFVHRRKRQDRLREIARNAPNGGGNVARNSDPGSKGAVQTPAMGETPELGRLPKFNWEEQRAKAKPKW
jgi:hypothetical protein